MLVFFLILALMTFWAGASFVALAEGFRLFYNPVQDTDKRDGLLLIVLSPVAPLLLLVLPAVWVVCDE